MHTELVKGNHILCASYTVHLFICVPFTSDFKGKGDQGKPDRKEKWEKHMM